MPLFVCDECSAIDNTATGSYWSRERVQWKDRAKNGKALCSQCSPTEYSDGSLNSDGGKWHGLFTRTIATPEVLVRMKLKNFVYLGPFEHLWEETKTKRPF